MLRPRLSALFVALVTTALCGQTAETPIEPLRLAQSDPALIKKLAALRAAGKLLSIAQVHAAVKTPSPEPLTLVAPATTPLRPAEIVARARKAMLRIGWFYWCKNCNAWHTNMMGGYAITADGVVATCFHGLEPNEDDMREAYLFAANTDGEVFSVRSILAADRTLDAVILRIDCAQTNPLPLSDQHAAGDAVYILSDPEHVGAYFSAGLINRFYWNVPGNPPDRTTLSGVRHLRIHVSVDWAPGSSGAAILDECGNAVGHVARIQPLIAPATTPAPSITTPIAGAASPATRPASAPDPTPRPAYMILHEAIPARGVRLLAESMNLPPHPAAGDGRRGFPAAGTGTALEVPP